MNEEMRKPDEIMEIRLASETLSSLLLTLEGLRDKYSNSFVCSYEEIIILGTVMTNSNMSSSLYFSQLTVCFII